MDNKLHELYSDAKNANIYALHANNTNKKTMYIRFCTARCIDIVNIIATLLYKS